MESCLKKLKLVETIQARMNLPRVLKNTATMESDLKKLRRLVETVEPKMNRARVHRLLKKKVTVGSDFKKLGRLVERIEAR
ncbi:unnamed protein product [Cyprideis torosa]|uniref:Uncharacterized protein n=1 Tax=Cyprideis torosa TaxID=163714 RepID=A0A7R8X156_9CRUS|nr:unnamed protein product [Cyprideis torosa]CAG0911130.1 unnamed protein product [Cyprideis torosa]